MAVNPDPLRRGLDEIMARIDAPAEIRAEVQRELDGAEGKTVRRDCAFCGRERSRNDDNHGPGCYYWDFFPKGEGENA